MQKNKRWIFPQKKGKTKDLKGIRKLLKYENSKADKKP